MEVVVGRKALYQAALPLMYCTAWALRAHSDQTPSSAYNQLVRVRVLVHTNFPRLTF
jgi:hypothetical protein